MASWHLPMEDIMQGMTLPQLKLLLWARNKRVQAERRWQLTVAAFPLSENPGEQYESLMEQLDIDEPSSGPEGWRPSSRLPLLHELDENSAAALGLPVRFVTVRETEE